MANPMSHSEKAILLEKTRQSDGMGGWVIEWAETAEFKALIMLDSSMEARIAERQGVVDLYSVMVEKSFPIESGDYFRRKSDGAIFRITSSPDENVTPAVSSLDVKSFTAAKTTLPTS